MSTQLTNGQQKSKLHTGFAHTATRDGKAVITGFINLDVDGKQIAVIERAIDAGKAYQAYDRSGNLIGHSAGFNEIIGSGADSPTQWAEFTVNGRTLQVVVFTAWRSLACPTWWYKTQAECQAAATKALNREPNADDPQERAYAFKRLMPDRTQKFATREGTVITPSATDFSM